MKKILTNSRFIAWAIGLASDRLGNSLYTIVLPLMVYHMTASLGNMAIVSVCQFAPRVFPGIYAGSLVDISDKKILFFFALIAQLLISFAMAVLYSIDQLSFPLLCLLAALLSIFFEISRTAEMTLIPFMFAEDRADATTTLASVHTAMFMLGPLLGATMLKYFSYPALLSLNALTYVVPLLANRWTRIPSFQSPEYKSRNFREKLVLTNISLIEALSTVHKSKPLQLLILFILFIMLATGGLELLIIFYTKNTLHVSDQFASLLYAAGASGMFIGTLLVPVFRKMKRKLFLFITLIMIAMGVLMFQLGTLPALICAQLLTFTGIFACSVTKDLIIQESAPPAMLGRISGLLRLINSSMISLSTVFLTALSSVISFQQIAVIIILLVFIALVLSQHSQFSKTHLAEGEYR
ncbi:enterobactin exporter EntS [compost metagenome]